MSAQAFENPEIGAGVAAGFSEHAFHFLSQRAQPGDLLLDLLELTAREAINVRAGLAPVAEVQCPRPSPD